MPKKQIIKIKYIKTDRFCRPIFRAINKQMYFGSTEHLFRDYEDEENIINFFEENIEELTYFGSHFGCEPLGLPIKEMGVDIKLKIVRGKEN